MSSKRVMTIEEYNLAFEEFEKDFAKSLNNFVAFSDILEGGIRTKQAQEMADKALEINQFYEKRKTLDVGNGSNTEGING